MEYMDLWPTHARTKDNRRKTACRQTWPSEPRPGNVSLHLPLLQRQCVSNLPLLKAAAHTAKGLVLGNVTFVVGVSVGNDAL